jgi:hypothetical protein
LECFPLAIPEGTVMLNDSMHEIFMYMVPIFGLIFISIGFLLHKKQLTSIVSLDDLNERISQYQRIAVLRFALIEGAGMFALMAYILTMQPIYIVYLILVSSIFILIFPSHDKIASQLNISKEELGDFNNISTKQNNTKKKKAWLAVPILALIIFLTYDDYKELFVNSVRLPDVEVDSGEIIDSLYINDYLKWSFIIPQDYSEIPVSELEHAERTGNKATNSKSRTNKDIVRLLNITNGNTDFMSNLNYRVFFPEIQSEEDFLRLIEDQFTNIDTSYAKVAKRGEGSMIISGLEFKYIEFLLTKEGQAGLLYITRFNEDFMLNFSMNYTDSDDAIKFLRRLQNSKLNWD